MPYTGPGTLSIAIIGIIKDKSRNFPFFPPRAELGVGEAVLLYLVSLHFSVG